MGNKASPYYNVEKSYEENLENGPYGSFIDGKKIKVKDKPRLEFLGYKVFLPFGIPAGPLLDSKFCTAALQKGFDIVVYKTVRGDLYPCHPWPNILSVKVKGNLTIQMTQKKALVAGTNYSEKPLSITNSFGVPSRNPKIWQKDVKKALKKEQKGQLVILSFMGTVKKKQTRKDFIADYVKAAKLSKQTGAKILEMNLSCPNIGNEGLVCYNIDITREICRAVRKAIGKTPLIIKIGYFQSDKELLQIALIADQYVDAISAINTLQAKVVDTKGNQALPGENRFRSGICGNAIRWAGLDMVKRLKALREKHHFTFSIIGVGGVMTVKDYFDYKKAGADAVMSATGSMWNPYLAYEIKKQLGFDTIIKT